MFCHHHSTFEPPKENVFTGGQTHIIETICPMLALPLQPFRPMVQTFTYETDRERNGKTGEESRSAMDCHALSSARLCGKAYVCEDGVFSKNRQLCKPPLTLSLLFSWSGCRTVHLLWSICSPMFSGVRSIPGPTIIVITHATKKLLAPQHQIARTSIETWEVKQDDVNAAP